MEQWREATNKVIAKNLLDHIEELTNGRWYRSETLDHTGRRTERYTVAIDITERSDSSGPNVSGSDTCNC